MFGGVNVRRIAKLKEIGEIKCGGLTDFIHMDAIYQLNFGWLKFGEPRMTLQIRYTFPPPNIPAIQYHKHVTIIIQPSTKNNKKCG